MVTTTYEGSARPSPADGAPESSRSAVSWPAVFAGGFITVAIGLMLFALGTGLGLSSVSPWGNSVSVTTFTVGAAIWLIIVQWLSAAIGAYVTGRLRTKWVDVHTDEVMFRDTAHGLLTWALSAVFGALLLASAASSILGGATQATAQAAGMAASQSNSGGSEPSAYIVDGLFRANQPPPNAPAQDVRPEATRILATSVKNGSMSQEDKTYLAQMISARTGLSQQDADKRIDDTMNQAKAAADTARKTGAKVAIYTFFSMLIGAFIAATAGAIGGRARDA